LSETESTDFAHFTTGAGVGAGAPAALTGLPVTVGRGVRVLAVAVGLAAGP
jgi:hypothetical protein